MQPGRNIQHRFMASDSGPLGSPQQVGMPSIEDQPAPARLTKLIAVVEDDEILAQTFCEVLQEERGWATLVLGDGEDALRVLPEIRPDMILLDMTLPGLDGVSLYRMLRARRETAATPILIVTGSHEWELQRVGLEPGQLLRKPFNVEDLIIAVEALLQDSPDSFPRSAAPE